jgi:MOSC domain-containing protein YiiM
MNSKSPSVGAILIGKAILMEGRNARTAIAKKKCDGTHLVNSHGLVDDEQGDSSRHGGVEKAIHHYPFDHYPAWQADLAGDAPLLRQPGAFGENISSLGMTEQNCCIGDIYRVGTTVLQVSQARQPCWKLNVRFNRTDMARRVQETKRTGWYYRVLTPGAITAGEPFALLERPYPQWTLARLLDVFYDKSLCLDRRILEEIAVLEPLSLSWRKIAIGRLERGTVEDWSPRLDGASP